MKRPTTRSIIALRSAFGATVLLATAFAGALFVWATSWTVPRVAAASHGLELAGHWDGADGPGGKLDRPNGITVAPDGGVCVADSGNHRVVLLSKQGEYVSEWRIPDADPAIHSPVKIAVSPDGRLVYATNYAANRIIVLRLTERAAATGG